MFCYKMTLHPDTLLGGQAVLSLPCQGSLQRQSKLQVLALEWKQVG